MAEVITGGPASLNLRGASAAAEVAPTVGTAGRVAVNDNALSGLLAGAAKIGGAILESKAASARAAAKRSQDAAANESAQGSTNLEALLLSDASSEEVASLVYGVEQETGAVVSPTKRAALQEAVDFRDRYQKARDNGQTELAARLAYNRFQNQMLQRHPDLAPEFATVRSSLVGDTIAFVAEDDKAQRDRMNAQKDARLKLVADAGYDTTVMTPGDIEVVAQNQVTIKQGLVSLAQQLEAANARAELDKVDGQPQRRQLAATSGNLVIQDAVTRLNAEIDAAGEDPVARQQAGLQFLQQHRASTAAAFGIPANSPEFNNYFGSLYESLGSNVSGLASGSTAADGVKNRNALVYSLAESGSLKRYPGLAVAKVVDSYLGRAIEPFMALPQNRNVLTRVLAASQQDDAINEVQNFQTGDPDGSAKPTSTIVNESRAAADTAKRLYTDQAFTTPEGKNAVYISGLGYLTSPRATEDLGIIRNSLDVLADPRWVQAAGGKTPPERATQVMNLWVQKLDNDTASVLGNMGDNVVMNVDMKTGNVRMTQKTYNRSQATTLRQLEDDTNKTIRAYAHLNNSTNYGDLLRVFMAEGQARAQATEAATAAMETARSAAITAAQRQQPIVTRTR